MAWKCLTFSFWLLLRRFCGSRSIEVVGRGREEQKKRKRRQHRWGWGVREPGCEGDILRTSGGPHSIALPGLTMAWCTSPLSLASRVAETDGSSPTVATGHGIFRKCLGNIELKSGGRGGRQSVLQGRPEHQSTCLERRGPRRRGVRGAQGERGILETGSPSGPDLGDRRCA